MLLTSAGVEPATSRSPVGRRIQLSHRGRPSEDWSDCINAQADLNLCWMHMSEGTFSYITAQAFYAGMFMECNIKQRIFSFLQNAKK